MFNTDLSEEQFEEGACGYQSTARNKRGMVFAASSPASVKDLNFLDNESCEGTICEYSGSYVKMSRADDFAKAEKVHRRSLNAKKHFFEGFLEKCLTLISNLRTTLFTEEMKVYEIDDGVQNYRDRGTARHCLNNNSGIITLKDSLNYFGLHELFRKLEESLEDVKRNKITKQEHEQCLKVVDKEVQKLSIKFHPDRVRNKGGSDKEIANAHKLQSVLNATRKALTVLTGAFLEDLGFDYKYEYFANLATSSLVNESEMNKRITRVLYKISELSEIKRMNIVGEVHNFLVESQRGVKSYFEGNKNDFKKYRNYALYHLGKNIEGYEKLEIECSEIDECKEGGDDDIRTAVLKMARQSRKQSLILRRLESVARRSVKGNFEIFPVYETMDSYYILPFVYYVNILSMCNLVLEDRRSWSFGILHENPAFEKERPLFCQAYYLASYIYNQNRYRMKVADIIGRHDCAINIKDAKKKLNDILEEIGNVLEKEFSISAYSEGKSNRMQLQERLLEVKGDLADIQEKEKSLRGYISRCEQESDENCENLHLVEGEGKETEKMFQEHSNRNICEQFTGSVFSCTQNIKDDFREDIRKFKKESKENRKQLDQILKKEKEMEEKFQENLEWNKKIKEQFSEMILLSKQKGICCGNESRENKKEDDENWKYAEREEILQKGFDLIKKIGAQLNESSIQSEQKLVQNETQYKRRRGDQIVEKDDAGFEEDFQKKLHRNKEISEQCYETEQNAAENEAQEQWTRNKTLKQRDEEFGEKFHKKFEKNKEMSSQNYSNYLMRN